MKKTIAYLLAVGMACMGNLQGKDVDGNPITEDTLFGDVDGTNTTIADLGQVIAPDYFNLFQIQTNIAIGVNSRATAAGLPSIAIGTNANASGNCSIAIGASALATQSSGVALGCAAQSTAANGIAVGLGAKATQSKAIAIGQGANANASGAVQIGSGNNTIADTVKFFNEPVFSNGMLNVGVDYKSDGIATTNAVKSIVTETYITGYTDWTFSGDVVEGVVYSVRQEEPVNPGSYMWTLLADGVDRATTNTSEFQPLSLTFTLASPSGTIIASRQPKTKNKLGLARYSDLVDYVTKEEFASTLANMDTSYTRTIGLTNKNQTVQYVVVDSQEPSSLNIEMPTDGETKDFLVYVLSVTNVTIRVQSATYWATSDKVFDDIPGNTPTALYFSQVADHVYSIGRQTLTSLQPPANNTIPSN